ncbi:MAG: glycosyltransferase family 4 protein [Patescibacteria group bacterium]
MNQASEKKIAIVTAVFPPYQGGMGNSAYEIARLLAEQNEVTVFTPDYSCHSEDEESKSFAGAQDDKVEIKSIKPLLQLGFGAFIPSLYKYLKNEKNKYFDIIYLHYPFFGGAEIVWLFKLLNPKIKLIIHFHMDTPALNWRAKILSRPSLMIKKSLFKRADKVISASLDYVAHSSIKKYFQKWPEKFREIPFGVHLDRFHVFPYDILELQILRNKLGIKKGERVILFVGALDEAHSFKGVGLLIRAFALIIQNSEPCLPAGRLRIKNVKLLIVGEGDRRQNYEKLAEELKIEKDVIFAGSVSDEELVNYYNLADIFVLPSVDKSEAFGIVLIEAMACGVPVMASDLPGVRSVFQNGAQGITVAPGSARHLQKKLEEYLRNPQRRLKMGRAARELVEEKYDWKKIGEKLRAIIN